MNYYQVRSSSRWALHRHSFGFMRIESGLKKGRDYLRSSRCKFSSFLSSFSLSLSAIVWVITAALGKGLRYLPSDRCPTVEAKLK